MIQQGLEKRERTGKIIAATTKIIQDAKNSGIDTQRAAILLNKAQEILKDAQELSAYDEALKYAQNARNLITTLRQAFRLPFYEGLNSIFPEVHWSLIR